VWAWQDALQRHNDFALWGLLPLLRRHPPRLTIWQRDVVGATLHQLVPAVLLVGSGRPKDNSCYWGLAVDAQADIRAPERSKLHDEAPLPVSAETSRHGTLGVQTGQVGRIYLFLIAWICARGAVQCGPLSPLRVLRDCLGHALAAFSPAARALRPSATRTGSAGRARQRSIKAVTSCMPL
jgi:hypothetical protein